MAKEKPSAKGRLAEYLACRAGGAITEEEFALLQEQLAPVSAGYLRRLLRQSGVPLDPLVEGVRQDNLGELHRTLLALERVYCAAKQAGDRARQQRCRRLVIEAKDHARWALRRSGEAAQRAFKEEAIQWMLVWLENPEVFPVWAELRLRQVEKISPSGCAPDGPGVE